MHQNLFPVFISGVCNSRIDPWTWSEWVKKPLNVYTDIYFGLLLTKTAWKCHQSLLLESEKPDNEI